MKPGAPCVPVAVVPSASVLCPCGEKIKVSALFTILTLCCNQLNESQQISITPSLS